VNSDAAAPARAPDLIEPIIGFRQWRLAGGVLKSMFIADDWRDAEQHARCYVGNHDPANVPAKECSCGIYGYYDPVPRTASAGTRELVGGVVVLWGQVELHVSGMRAEHALLVALELPLTGGRKRREVIKVADSLGVPAVSHRKLKAAAKEYGRVLGRELRPARGPGYPYDQIGMLPTVPWSALAPERRRRYRRRIIPRG
jgi:hypothetical protein